jgi:hypothetical protein
MANIRKIVTFALHRHLNVILNAQTEISLGYSANENLPTAATFAFWRRMTRYYGDNPHVVFDLFNEPRFCNWAQWTRSMQPLVDYVRRIGSLNQLWAEGLWWGSTFAGLPHLLSGQGIVYSFHHPGAPWPWQGWVPGYQPGVMGPPLWNAAFGDLAARGVPMVNGEFVNYIGGYYWPHSTQMVSQYMRYLAKHHIGMVAWSLQPGIMTASTKLGSAVSEPQGAGRLVWVLPSLVPASWPVPGGDGAATFRPLALVQPAVGQAGQRPGQAHAHRLDQPAEPAQSPGVHQFRVQ